MPLDVGELRAKLKLEGADAFKQDLDTVGRRFRDMGTGAEQAEQATRRAMQSSAQQVSSFTQSTRQDANRAGDALQQMGQGAQTSVQQLQTELHQLQQQLQQTGQDAQDAGQQGRAGLQGMLAGLTGDGDEAGQGLADHLGSGFAGRIAGMGSSGGPIGAAIAAGLAVQVGIPIAAGKRIAELAFEGMQLQAERLVSKAQFGFSPQQFANVGKAAGDAYGNNFGESVNSNIQAAGIAMQAGLLKGDATAAEIQPVIEKLSTVSTLLGTDVVENARAAAQMVKTGLAKNATEAFDLMVVAQQKGLNLSGDLTDTLVEYSTQYRKLGIDGATALGTISQMLAGGARDTDLAADALKEFSIRVVDGSESTQDAYKSLGLNVEATTAAFGKGGESARQMTDVVVDRLRAIQDPIERNRIGVELFGTQWEDLGGAINKMDLSKAANEFGKISGATDKASTDMSNGATSFEAAKRKITMAWDDAKIKLGEQWSPTFAKLADWVSSHSDEIQAFLTGLAKWAGVGFGAIISGAGMVTTVLGGIVTVVGSVAEGFIRAFGQMAVAIGSIQEKIPGMQGIGRALKSAGESAIEHAGDIRKFGVDMTEAGWATAQLGGKLGALAYQLDQIPAGKAIEVTAPGGQEVLTKLTEMGVKVHSDNNKNIVVDAPLANNVLAQLQKIGLEVETRNGKQVIVKADDSDYQAKKTDWTKTETKWIETQMRQGKNPLAPASQGGLSTDLAPQRASGGPIVGPGGPRDDSIPIWASNGEFMMQASAVSKYGVGFMHLINAGKFADGGPITDNGLPAGTSIGYGGTGFPDWVTQLGAAHNVKPSTYAGHQETDRGEAGYAANPQGLNRGIDWGGSTDQLQAFAEYLMSIAPSTPALEQIIWQNPETGQKIGWYGRSPDTDGSYFAADYGGHTDHVHMRASGPIGATGATGSGIQDITLTSTSSKDDVARKIIAEGRRRGYTDEEIKAVLATANQESGLQAGASGGGGAWHGIFQQDSGYPGRDDPNTNITGFYDRLDEKRKSSGASKDIWKNIFWLQQRPGISTADEAYSGGRTAYLSEIQSQADVADEQLRRLGPGVGTTTQQTTTTTTGGGSGSAQNVFVVGGRLDGTTTQSGDQTTTTTTKTDNTGGTTSSDTLALKTEYWPMGRTRLLAGGGPVIGPGGPTSDDVPIWGSNGEYMIRAAAVRKYGPKMMAAINDGTYPQMLATGGMVGFGGYSENTRDSMAPKNFYDWIALGVGAAFAIDSLVEPYINMATSKKIDLGSVTPDLNTGNNTSGIASSVVNQLGGQIMQQLAAIEKAIREGKNIKVTIEGDQGNSPARMVGLGK